MRILTRARKRLVSAGLCAALASIGLVASPSAAYADGGGLPQAADIGIDYTQLGGGADGLVFGPDGNLWGVSESRYIAAFSPTSDTVVARYDEGEGIGQLISGPDASIWFVQNLYGSAPNSLSSVVGEISMSGTITDYPLPAGDGLLTGIAQDSSGNVWFTTASSDANDQTGYIGYIAPGGAVTQYPMPAIYQSTDSNGDLVAGPDGNMWFVGQVGTADTVTVGSVTPAGVFSFYGVPLSGEVIGPSGITVGSDGNLWFTFSTPIGDWPYYVGSLDPVTGVVNYYALPANFAQFSGITEGQDGNVYVAGEFAGSSTTVVIAVSPTGQTATFTGSDSFVPYALTPGPDGNIWMADQGAFAELTVTKPYSTAMTMTPDADPAYFGQQGNIVVNLTPDQSGAPVPTGTVTFAQAIQNYPVLATEPVLNGVADLPLADLPTGQPDRIVATYSGDANYGPESADELTETVDGSQTTTTLTSSDNPSTVGQDVQVTATVTGQGGGIPPCCTVVFTVDGASQPVSLGADGTATLDLPSLTGGTHSITANFNAWSAYGASSASLTQTVNASAAVATVALSTTDANPSYGEPVTVSAVVSGPSGSPTPTGTVAFAVNGTQTTATLDSTGTATFALPAGLAPGAYPVTAAYSGDVTYPAASASPLTETVQQDATTTTLTSSANPVTVGQPVTFTANVAANSPGSGSPTGSVVFTLDGVAQPAVPLTSGSATFATSSLATGSHTLTAAYSGDADFATGSSSALTETVNPVQSVTVSSSANPSVNGQTVTFTAHVAPATTGGATPTGTVTFTLDGVAQSPVTLRSGSGTLKVENLAAGQHTVTVAYSGDTKNPPGSSATFTQVVDPAATTVTLTSSANPAGYDESVTFAASVKVVSPGTGTVTGSVEFLVDGVAQPAITLSSGKAELKLATLSPGAHTVLAVYAGTTGYQGGQSGALTETVDQSATAVTLTSSANPVIQGKTVTFTAEVKAVSPGTGTVTGNVVFLINGVVQPAVVLSSGKAKFATSALTSNGLTPASYSIVAQYEGSTGYAAGQSATLTQVVDTNVAIDAVAPAGPRYLSIGGLYRVFTY